MGYPAGRHAEDPKVTGHEVAGAEAGIAVDNVQVHEREPVGRDLRHALRVRRPQDLVDATPGSSSRPASVPSVAGWETT
jgi:hypothetical protein